MAASLCGVNLNNRIGRFPINVKNLPSCYSLLYMHSRSSSHPRNSLKVNSQNMEQSSSDLHQLQSNIDSLNIQSSDEGDDASFGEEVNVNTSDSWRDTINKVVPAIVVVRVTAVRSFDTEQPSSGHATGFVVDKRRGIILTNRHVVKPGPVVAEAIFSNHEEIPVYPIYRDPVHDFGFFRYDPGAIHFLDYEEIPLAPEAACVGLEIRVVGNDSCEKVSILAGTLARLDRAAPTYRKDGYNDFNTFYIQAASGTKGGSSGSPVIDLQGRAVALNAGGKTSSSSSAFYLPLDRVVRALRILQKGQDSYVNKWQTVSIPRGTLQVTFCHKGFDETRRLGLRSETEQMVRHASPLSETGMLVVETVVPGGPAYKQLEPGDVLVRMNGEVVTKFLKMEILLDDNVNQKIELQIERGSISLTVKIEVQDLHSITPDYFLEVSGAVIHPLSYQQARNFRFHCGVVYVADPGYMLFRAGIPRHAIIKKLANVEISRLDDLISALCKLSKGSRVPMEYITHLDRHRRKTVLVTVDRHEWYDSPKIYKRDDCTGLWMARPIIQEDTPLLCHNIDCGDGSGQNNKLSSSHKTNASGGIPGVCSSHDTGSNIHDPTLSSHGRESLARTNASFAEHVVESSLVVVEVSVPSSCLVDGVNSQYFTGTGVVIHHSEALGLVVVDRKTVAVSACDVMLSFAAFPVEIPGEVVFLHPIYNYAIIAYNPSALGAVGASRVQPAEMLPEPALFRGDSVYLVGLSKNRAISRKSIVTNSSLTLNISPSDSPRYRAINLEVIELDNDFGSTLTGVLCNEQGKVQALWASFSFKLTSGGSSSKDQQWARGIPICMISHVLDKVLNGGNVPSLPLIRSLMPLIRILEVELCPRLLSKARNFGLTDDLIQVLLDKDPLRQQILRVKCCFAGSKVENLLKQGDMLLAVNKEPVTCFYDIEKACQALDKCENHDGTLNMTVFREGSEEDVIVGTDTRDGNGTTRLINWSGCVIQDSHPAVRALGFLPDGLGVFVSRRHRGSPADRYGLHGHRWIVEVNGKQTPDLDAFINVTKEVAADDFVRVRTVNLQGKPQVLTLKQDLHYWPTWELRFNQETGIWCRSTIKTMDSSNQ